MNIKKTSVSHPDVPCLLWNDREVAAAIGLNVKRVQELARMGILPAFKVGRRWQFDPDAVRSWVKSKSNGSSPTTGGGTGASQASKRIYSNKKSNKESSSK